MFSFVIYTERVCEWISLAIGLIGVDSFAFLFQDSLVNVMNDTFQNTLTQAV